MFNALPSTPSDTTTTTASKAACDSCRSRKKKCDGLSPCALCCQRGIECVFTAARKRGPKALKLDSSSARPAKTLSCSSSFAFNDAAVDAKDVLSSCKTSSLSPSCNPLSTPTLLPDSSLSSSTNATISTSGSPTDTIPFFSGFSDLSTLPDLRKFTAAVAGVDVVQHLPKTTASILSVAEQNRLALERFLIYEFFGTVHTAFSLFDHVDFLSKYELQNNQSTTAFIPDYLLNSIFAVIAHKSAHPLLFQTPHVSPKESARIWAHSAFDYIDSCRHTAVFDKPIEVFQCIVILIIYFHAIKDMTRCTQLRSELMRAAPMYHWGKNDCPIPYSSPTLKLRHKVLWAHVFFLDTINSIINNESVMGDDFDFLHLLDEQDWQEAGLPRDPVFSAPAVQRVMNLPSLHMTDTMDLLNAASVASNSATFANDNLATTVSTPTSSSSSSLVVAINALSPSPISPFTQTTSSNNLSNILTSACTSNQILLNSHHQLYSVFPVLTSYNISITAQNYFNIRAVLLVISSHRSRIGKTRVPTAMQSVVSELRPVPDIQNIHNGVISWFEQLHPNYRCFDSLAEFVKGSHLLLSPDFMMSSLSLKSCNSLSANILFLQCLVRLHAFNHKIHPTETFRISLTSSSKYAASSAIGTASNHSPNLSSLLATSSDIILVVSNAMSSMIVTCTALPTLESINVMMKNPLVAQSVITIIDALLSIITETPKQPTSRITTWAVNSKIKESVLRAIVDLYLPLLEGQSDFDETSKVFHSILKPLITQMSFSITLSNYGIGAAGAKGSSTNGGGCDK